MSKERKIITTIKNINYKYLFLKCKNTKKIIQLFFVKFKKNRKKSDQTTKVRIKKTHENRKYKKY
jgi:hypothetical protein